MQQSYAATVCSNLMHETSRLANATVCSPYSPVCTCEVVVLPA
jgi:hypothetical protein